MAGDRPRLRADKNC